MYALIAFIPIILTIFLMLVLNLPAKNSLPIAWISACTIAFVFWKMDLSRISAYTITGFLNALETVIIILGAILIMNVMSKSGAMFAINKTFKGLTKDFRILAILIGFVFSAFIEGSAGFGTPGALCAPLLISVGFPPLAAAIICLQFNSVPVSFGAVGTPTNTAFSVVKDVLINAGVNQDAWKSDLCFVTTLCHAAGSFFIVIFGLGLICKLFGPNKRFKDIGPVIPFCLFTICVFDIVYISVAKFLGAELVSLLASLVTLFVDILAIKKNFLIPKDILEFDDSNKWEKDWLSNTKVNEVKESDMPIGKAFLPYILIITILVFTRMSNALGWDFAKQLKTFTIGTGNNELILGLDWNYAILWSPGIVFIFISILTILLQKVNITDFKDAIKSTNKMVWGSMISLMFGVAMVNIFRYTNICSNCPVEGSMLFVMAKGLASVFSNAYISIAPFIGVLGAFMSGSNTVSNTLFTSLQFETATLIAVPQILIVALQNVGGAIGNMICVNNVVAVCTTTGTTGKEGTIIKKNLLPCFVYCIITVFVVVVLYNLNIYSVIS